MRLDRTRSQAGFSNDRKQQAALLKRDGQTDRGREVPPFMFAARIVGPSHLITAKKFKLEYVLRKVEEVLD